MNRLLVNVKQAAFALNVSARTVWTLIVQRKIRSTRIGRRVLIPMSELRRIVQADETFGQDRAS